MDDASAEPCQGHDETDCIEALQQLYWFLDGELTEARRVRIGVHLDRCSDCLEAFDFEAELKAIIHHRCRDEPPEHLRLRVARALEELDRPPGPPSDHR